MCYNPFVFFAADLHLHSKYSRATSREMDLENMWKWGQLKGIKVITAADFTHPLWFAELQSKLEPAEPGLYKLQDSIEKRLAAEVPESCKSDVRFILTTEISSIYSKNGRTRKVHNIVFAPSLETAQKINTRLGAIGNLRADGRPILGLDSKLLLKMVLDASRENALVPAHAWTPHFSVFGSNSGFNTLEECFEELTPHIFAIETGLSSDPEMNWRLSQLDNITLISNSDAHSATRIGRECNIFNTELSYNGIITAMKKDPSREGMKLAMTIEFFPEEGKYHVDGHRNCGARLAPSESIKRNNICPTCGKPVTIGVLHRVEEIADRPEGFRLRGAPQFKKLVGLLEIIAEAFGTGPVTVGVKQEFKKLTTHFGNELKILLKVPISDLQKFTHPFVSEGVKRVREDKVIIDAGYDGEYGKVHLFSDEERGVSAKAQEALF